MNFKKSLLIAAIASVAATSAVASTTAANPTYTGSFVTGYSFYDNTLSGSFTETYTFTALSSGTYSFLNNGYNTITGFTGNLFDVTVPALVGNFQTTYTGNGGSWDAYTVAGAFNLTQGHQYAFSFSGNTTDPLANYSGTVAAPVPEPETFAMLLAGLGLIGAVTRRRNKLSVA